MSADRPPAGEGRAKVRLASNDGVYLVEVEGPSREAAGMVESAARLWTVLIEGRRP